MSHERFIHPTPQALLVSANVNNNRALSDSAARTLSDQSLAVARYCGIAESLFVAIE